MTKQAGRTGAPNPPDDFPPMCGTSCYFLRLGRRQVLSIVFVSDGEVGGAGSTTLLYPCPRRGPSGARASGRARIGLGGFAFADAPTASLARDHTNQQIAVHIINAPMIRCLNDPTASTECISWTHSDFRNS